MKPRVAVLRTSPGTVLEDYQRLMRLAGYRETITPANDTIIKLNLSWTKSLSCVLDPAVALEGVLRALFHDGFSRERVFPVENKTVVTDPQEGARNNGWLAVLQKRGLPFIALPQVRWVKFPFKSRFLAIDRIFPEGIEIPEMFIGKNVIHLPTVKTHGHSITTGAIKNAFGGLLKEVRHHAHERIHEVLVDLMLMQKEIHPGIFTVMDGTVCGDGAGPRTMLPRVKGYILAGADSVAIDAVAAKMMGFDPLNIPYLRMCHEMGLGAANLNEIEIVGENIADVSWGFKTKKSIVIWGDQMLRRGPLRFLAGIALRSPLFFWAPLASNIYHDWLWYPTVGKKRIAEFMKTGWGDLFRKYVVE